jgi:hypothetical protein
VNDSGPNAGSGSDAEAASANDVLLIATPWQATKEVVTHLGDLSKKILIDATNPVLPTLDGLSVEKTTSAGELIQEWTGAKVVKAFNTIGFNIMADPVFKNEPVALFYCGDDSAAKASVASLIAELGFDALDAGPLKQSRVLEQFAVLWISLAVKQGFGREIAFRFLRR